MRKSLVCISSGQDSAAVLYDTLKNTDDEVYARYIRFPYHYSKNNLDFAEPYILNVVNWCKENIRDFDYGIEVAESPNWSFNLSPEDRVCDQLPKKVLDKYEGTPVLNYKSPGLEGVWNRYLIAKKLKVDAAIIGKDLIQEYHDISYCNNTEWNEVVSQNWSQYDNRHTCDLTSFWYELTDIPLEAPLAYKYKLSRLGIYDMLPVELKSRINQCANIKREGENWCGECERCLTRQVYEARLPLVETKSYTMEQVDKIFHKYFEKNSLDKIASQSARIGYRDCLTIMFRASDNQDEIDYLVEHGEFKKFS
jgi:hypothetical protein